MEVSGKRNDTAEEEPAMELEKLCQLCEADHVKTAANGICRECEEYMCNTCFRHHRKGKLCRHHVLIDLNESLTSIQRSAGNVEKCKRHADESIKIYCRKHVTVGCGDCMIPRHSACKPENIKDLSKEFERNEDFKNIMAKIEDIASAINTSDKKIQESKKENKRMLEDALKAIQNFRTEVNKHLEKVERNIITEVKEIERMNYNLLIKLEQDCKLFSSQITEIRQKLDTGLYKGSALFIQYVECKPKIMDIERTCTKIQKEDEIITTFKFKPNEQLQQAITSIEKLGQVTKLMSSTKSETTTLIEQPHSRKVSNAKSSTEEVTERDEPPRNDRNMGIEEKQKGRPTAGDIAVGSRVRPVNIGHDDAFHRDQSGTVTAVHTGGRVDVKWDATGKTGYGYIVGEYRGVKLI